jgi:hypothetical protein
VRAGFRGSGNGASGGRSTTKAGPSRENGTEVRVNIADTEDDHNCVLHGGKPYTGEAVEMSDEGNLISLYNYYAGVQDGPYSEWYGPAPSSRA